jgi:hypothetical protein
MRAFFDFFKGVRHSSPLTASELRVTREPLIQCLFRTEEVDDSSTATHKQRR